MLGQAFLSHLAGEDIVCVNRSELDYTRAAAIRARFRQLRPNIIINCAGDTDVEGAEENQARAFAANALLPEILAQICRQEEARLVHFSSTGCYGDTKPTPYDDYDDLHPTTVHHRSKAAGERAVRSSGANHLILRLGWLFGGSTTLRKNFVWARISEARGKARMDADPTQFGTPTFVADVVTQTMAILAAGLTGTYNCVATGAASRLEYVRKILEFARLDTQLVPATFERKAPVSSNETAINLKLDLLGMNRMPHWEYGLRQYVSTLLEREGRSVSQ
jgi:dTDP-4-dehydrorhamnose reductase